MALWRCVPLQAALVSLLGWARGAGGWGVLGFFAAYVAGTVLFLPGSVLTLGAGFVYGLWAGVPLVSAASVAGASLAFALGRTAARPWVERRAREHPRFAAVDAAVARRGFRVVLLLRLSPVLPFNLLNYALSLTRVSFGDYLGASALGMLPGTVLYVYLGSLVVELGELASGGRPSGGWAARALLLAGLVATAGLTVWLARVARAALEREAQ